MKVKSPPIYSLYKFIYPGPHIDQYGKLSDDRVRFGVPFYREEDTIVYLIFPYNGSDKECVEERYSYFS